MFRTFLPDSSVPCRRRGGFTLVELLVVIAIIGILIALLLPAVQAAREAARRSQCTNNLKQIALAVHNYHDTYKSFPPGTVTLPGTGNNDATWGWAALVLPFMEQKTIHDNLQVGTIPLSAYVAGTAGTGIAIDSRSLVIDTFICPSAGAPDLNDLSRFSREGSNQYVSNPPRVVPTSNYNAGFGHNRFRKWDNGQYNTVYSGGFAYSGGPAGAKVNAMANVSDGTSSSLMLGERAYELRGVRFYCGTWLGCYRGGHEDCGEDIWFSLRAPINSGQGGINFSNPEANSVQLWSRQEGLSSAHPGGVNVALFDGSVRFLSETIDYAYGGDGDSNINTTLERLAAIGDGFPVGDF